jgi:hypothetical protein
MFFLTKSELSVLDRWDMIPNSKFLILYKNRSLCYEAHYKFSPYSNTLIGRFNISNVIPGKNNGVKVKAEITKNGTFEIFSPQLVDVGKIKFETCQLSKEEINILVVHEVNKRNILNNFRINYSSLIVNNGNSRSEGKRTFRSEKFS